MNDNGTAVEVVLNVKGSDCPVIVVWAHMLLADSMISIMPRMVKNNCFMLFWFIFAAMGKPKRKQEIILKKQQQERRKHFFRNLKPVLWAFFAWLGLIGLINMPFLKEPVILFFVNFTTNAAFWVGTALHLPVESPGSPFLAVNGFSMQVVMECTAYNFYLFAIALTVFARWPLRNKFINLGIFLSGIFLLNNLRFISMGYLGSYRPDLFDSVHDIGWDVLFGFAVFGLWVWRDLKVSKLHTN